MATLIFGDVNIRPQNDIVLCLFDILPNREFVRLARTCRRLYELAQPQMPERQLIARYSTIKIEYTNYVPDVPEVFISTSASNYVTRLHYSVNWVWDRPTWKHLPEWHGNLKEARRRLYSRMEMLPFWSDRTRHIRLAKATKKNVFFAREALITMVTFWPNLNHIKYRGPTFKIVSALLPLIRHMWTHETISLLPCSSPWFPLKSLSPSPPPSSSTSSSSPKAAATSTIDTNTNITTTAPPPPPPPPTAHLPKITQLNLSPSELQEEIHLTQIITLLSMPTLLTLVINSKNIFPRSSRDTDQWPPSNVQHITLSFCRITPDLIVQMVQKCPNLTKLIIRASSRFWRRVETNRSTDPHQYILRMTEQLETLTLSDAPYYWIHDQHRNADDDDDDDDNENEISAREQKTTIEQHMNFLSTHDSTGYLCIRRYSQILIETLKAAHIYSFTVKPVLRSKDGGWHQYHGQMWDVVLETSQPI